MTVLALPLDFSRPTVPLRPSRRRRPPQTPLYEALAAEWAAAARMVPGDRDREWVDLVTRDIWSR